MSLRQACITRLLHFEPHFPITPTTNVFPYTNPIPLLSEACSTSSTMTNPSLPKLWTASTALCSMISQNGIIVHERARRPVTGLGFLLLPSWNLLLVIDEEQGMCMTFCNPIRRGQNSGCNRTGRTESWRNLILILEPREKDGLVNCPNSLASL